MAANVRLTSLSQFERMGCNVGVKCWCGRIVTVDPAVLVALCKRKGWPLDRLENVRGALVCTMCGARGKCKLGWSWDTPGRVTRPGRKREAEPYRAPGLSGPMR